MILVTGATGQHGSRLLHLLSERGVAARAMARNPAKAEAIAELPHVEIVHADMARPDTLPTALRGIDRAILISSATSDMADVQIELHRCRPQSRRRGMWSSCPGSRRTWNSSFRFGRMHGEIEKRLEASGMAWTHLRPGEFMTVYFRQVPAIANKGALLLPMEEARIASIDIGDIAEVAAKVLTTPGHEGKIYSLTGPEALTMSEVAAKLSTATGKPIRYVNIAPEDARQAQLAAGMPPFLADGCSSCSASGAEAWNPGSGRTAKSCSVGGRPRSTNLPDAMPRYSAAKRKRHCIKEPAMKYNMIRYQFANGTPEDWHREVARFIAALDGDPELKGKIGYRVMKNRDDSSYYHIASVVDDAAVKTLQSREFFKAYQAKTRSVAADGQVTVTPIEVIAETAG